MDAAYTTPARDGTPLGYRIARRQGHKHAITLIHGLASNLTRWTEFVSHSSLVEQFDLLRVDLRGRGTTPYHGLYTRHTWVEDIASIIEAEAYDKTVLIGHSMGAQVAIEYAQQQPQRCAGLVLIDPVFPQLFRGRLAIARRMHWMVWASIRLVWFMNRLGFKKHNIPNRDLHALDQATRQRLHDNPSLDIGDLYTNPLKDAKYLPLANYLQDLYEVARTLPELSEIKVPVLVLLSKGSALSDQTRIDQQLAKLEHCKTVIIEANHWLLTERPEESRKVIETWLNHQDFS